MTRALKACALFIACAALAWAAFPRLTSVDPMFCWPGGEAATEGQNLDAANVAKLFLTAGGKDIELKIKEQTAESIRFVVPADADLGAYTLMIQTAGPTPTLMEQPVQLEVLDEAAAKARIEEERQKWERLSEAPPPPEPAPGPTPQP